VLLRHGVGTLGMYVDLRPVLEEGGSAFVGIVLRVEWSVAVSYDDVVSD